MILSERAFSTINYLFDKFCAKFLANSVDKGIYIYINERTLKRMECKFKVLSNLSEDDIADFEDQVIHLIKAKTDLVPTLCLPNIADIHLI